jgi:septum formation protein
MKPLILASQSPRRRELIKLLDRPFEVVSIEVDEIVREFESPEHVVCALAFEKAFAAVSRDHEFGCYIGSDTVVAIEGKIFGKPLNREEAKAMLLTLSANTHQVYTGIALIDQERNIKVVKAVRTDVVFRELTDSLIEWYLNTGEYDGKAGAYAIQGYGSRLVDSIHGDFFNVVGLPIATIDQMLTELAL